MPIVPSDGLAGIYDYRLVAVSVLISALASYAALDLGGRVTASRGAARSIWLMGGAAAMGMGIWSMHYSGMLAYSLPVPIFYHWPTVLLSLLAATAFIADLRCRSLTIIGDYDAKIDCRFGVHSTQSESMTVTTSAVLPLENLAGGAA